MPRILFTGGGTAGHVTPNVALIEAVRQLGWQIDYAGSQSGIEHEMISALEVPFHPIASGKLRRYFSWENFIDPFKIIWGILQALALCISLRPDVVFSKGGYVSVPVVVAAWMLRIPVISHESDVTPGLANKITYPFCKKICVTFDATTSHLPAGRVVVTGTPVRSALLTGDARRGLQSLGLDRAGVDEEKPLLLVFGGSLGAQVINAQVRSVLQSLLARFNIVHVTGAGNMDLSVESQGYVQREFIGDEFGDVLAAASLVVSRAGANTLYELFLLRKPHLLIPLTKAASRGDQLVNAATFKAAGYSHVIQEEALNDDTFVDAIFSLHENRASVSAQMAQFPASDSVSRIIDEIKHSL